MDPALFGLIQPLVAVSALLTVGIAVKFAVFGRGPIAGRRVDPGLEQRIADLEERLAQSSDFIGQQAEALADVEERLDFAERLLAQRGQEPRVIEEPHQPTPV
jgi:uncharacterized coiled-coil protein SlyX